MSELLDTTWTGDFESADIVNDSGWSIIKHPQFGPCLINLNLDDEGIENILPLLDLFQNPVYPVALLNKNGLIDLKYFPSFVIGKSYEAATTQEMLNLINPETGLPPDKQSLCVTGNLQEAVTYVLAGTNPHDLNSWKELRAKNILWSDIKSNPIQFPLSKNDWNTIFLHDHEGKYAELDINGKLKPSVITKFTLGSRLKADSEGEMLSLSASPGDICTRLDFNPRRSYICYGDPSNIDSWIYLEPPESGVESINGQTGISWLTAEDINAAEKFHTHEPPLYVVDQNGFRLHSKFTPETGELSIYIANQGFITLKFGHIENKSGELLDVDSFPTKHLPSTPKLEFKHDGENLFYSIDDGVTWLPFA